MEDKKTERLSIRITPEDKRKLELLAEADCRTVADEITWFIRTEYADREKEDWPV